MIEPTLLQGEGFRMRVDAHGSHLRAYVYDGVDSLAVSIAMWKMLSEQCRLHGTRQLLVIEDLKETVDLADIAAVIEAMVSFGFADIRIAFVELQNDIQGSEHGEVLALERNITVMVFTNEAEAKRWLLYGEQALQA